MSFFSMCSKMATFFLGAFCFVFVEVEEDAGSLPAGDLGLEEEAEEGHEAVGRVSVGETVPSSPHASLEG